MKYLFKQPLLYVGLALLAAAAVLLAVAAKKTPEQSIVNRLEKYYSTNEKADLMKCVAPEDRAAAEELWNLGAQADAPGPVRRDVRILTGEVTEDEETGFRNVELILIGENENGPYISNAYIRIRNVKGTDYLVVQ